MPIKDGTFEVPSEVLKAARTDLVAVEMNLPKDGIHIPLSAYDFNNHTWKLILDDWRFPKEYQNVIPKGSDTRSACVLVFSGNGEDTFLLDVNCRHKIKQ